MLPNDVAFSILKNKRAQAKAAAHPDQQRLTHPSPQNNLEGENAGLQSEVSQFIQRLEHKQKELAAREKQREKYEKERQDMMHPDQQTLPQAPALPQPDQDIQQVTQQNQNKFENGLGFKRSILEEMEMLGMIRKKKDDWADYDAVIPDDPLDEEFKCPACGGAGGKDEGGEDGVMRGDPDDYITCWTCKGSGSIEPAHHPGIDNQGAVAGTIFDIRDEDHREKYDAENAMPVGDTAYQTEEGILDPKRMGYERDGRMKQTRYPIATPQEGVVYHPELQHRLPAVYTREWDGQPSWSGMPLGVPGSDFKRSEPMDIAMQLLKRQTELGEHHEDLPSSHGPVVRYHGTKGDVAQDILQGENQGLKDLEDRSITDDPNEALSYGVERSNHRSGSTARAQEMYASAPAMVGVRRNAPMPQHYGRSHGMRSRNDFPDALHYGGAVDRKYLTPVNTNQFDRRDTIQNRNDRGDITDRTMNYPPISQNQNQKAQARFKEGQPGYKKPDIFGWDEKRNFPADDQPDLDGRFYTHEQEWNNQNNQRARDDPRVAHLNRFNRFRRGPSEAQMNYKPYNPQPAPVQQPADPQQRQLYQHQQQEQIQRGEPMDIVMRLLKHAETPEAKKHKSEYDTKYESTPDRIKYRTELTQERRKRHVDGKGGKDMSHTASGKIVPEDMHANRARHFKERGTLKKTVFVKQQCPTPSKKAYSNGEEAHQDASMMGGGLGVYQCPCGAYHFTSNQ